jgi:mannose-6-phosphate isomerase-like protein (cupin superfamily)
LTVCRLVKRRWILRCYGDGYDYIRAVENWLSRFDVPAEASPGDTVGVVALFDDAHGCEKFAQRVLRFGPGSSRERGDEASDEVLYVLDGSGTAAVAGQRVPLHPGVGLFVRRGTRWSLEAGETVELVSVLVHDPEPAPGPGYAAVDLAGEERRDATAARQFAIGVSAESGCPSVTQFIGFVPPGRAPDHFHRYDEVLYILEGAGTLHIAGEDAPLAPGACVHLPATLVHCLANTGEGEMRLLGVFRPSGSPAEAYYPDGTPAVYPS